MVRSKPKGDDGAPLYGLVYVSRVSVEPRELGRTLADIQTVSVARNTAFDITGVLIATPIYFAQYLEGARGALDTVMARIAQDPRHDNIRIVRDEPVQRRIGLLWRLMPFDTGSFEERHVTPVLGQAHMLGDTASTDALMHLVKRLVAATGEAAARPREPHA